jgi:PadR family transcriptional regulator, regulatory protein AphA
MADTGRVYWDAAPSQWYAEPKRLAESGYLVARKGPGRTRERTHYTLTAKGRAAIEDWARTPAPLPRAQHETVVRLLAADLVDPAAVLEGLTALGDEIEHALAGIQHGRALLADLPSRAHLLDVNHRYAERFLRLQREWLRDATKALAAVPPERP